MSTQTKLPYKEYSRSDLANAQIIRSNSSIGEEVIKIPLEKVKIRENFNVRKDYGDVSGLAQSIMENGQEIPAKVDAMADGTFVLTDGHRRYKALQVCEDSGMEVYLYAIVNKVRTTEEQRILQMFVTQDSKQLNASETAELFKRLENLGWTQEQIAKKVGKTQSYVSQMLSYANESPVIKAEVEAGNLTVANVLQMQKEHESQEERIDTVKEVVKRAKDEDVSTGKIISSDNKFKKAKRIAEEIITCYPELESQDVTEMANIIKKLL